MKCGNCNAVFDELDVAHIREDYGEVFACCPNCGSSDIYETEECKLCGKEFDEDELRDGFCLECLWNAIDYDTALAFLEESDQLTEFMLTRMGAGKLEHSSPEFDAFMAETFRREVANDKLTAHFVGETAFLKECRYWILPNYDNGDFGFGCEFAEWYADRLKKAKQENLS